MKSFVKTVLIAASLLLSAGSGFAVEVKTTATELKGAAKPAGESAKTDAKASPASGKENVNATAKAKLVDINTATEADLKAVPGIGAAYAVKIIAGRPYANKAQLKSRKVVPSVLYEQIKDRLIAKQPQK